MSSSDVFAFVAAVIATVSAVAAFLSYRSSKIAARRARMPALVLRPTSSGVIVANVGTGPAMNIIYAQGRQPVVLKKGINEPWFNPIHLEPIEPGGEQNVDWADPDADLGLRFTDAFGYTYVVKASEYGMVTLEGKQHLPDWRMDIAPYFGQIPEGKTSQHRWGESKRRHVPDLKPRWWEPARSDESQ
jgi:hypothetical protein